MVTPMAFAPTLRKLGLRTVDRPGDYYGFSLALGSADVTLLDLANAYRALANGGLAGAVRTIVGGAPVTEEFAREIGADAHGYDAANAVERVKTLVGAG